MQKPVNQKSCPFCKNVNHCMIQDTNPCWCHDVVIPAELTAMIPAHLQRKTCVCLTCINLFNENPEHFKNKYSFN